MPKKKYKHKPNFTLSSKYKMDEKDLASMLKKDGLNKHGFIEKMTKAKSIKN